MLAPLLKLVSYIFYIRAGVIAELACTFPMGVVLELVRFFLL